MMESIFVALKESTHEFGPKSFSRHKMSLVMLILGTSKNTTGKRACSGSFGKSFFKQEEQKVLLILKWAKTSFAFA